jgi:hypothetical protein
MNILAAFVGVAVMPLLIGYIYGRNQRNPLSNKAYYE